MYEEFFSLSGSPFRLAPDPKFFFGSKTHNKAMAYLHYGLRQAEGFIVVTGEIGAGKSILIGHLLDQLDRSNVIAATLTTPNLAADDLLSHILSAFRIEPALTGKTAEIEAFEDFLFDQMNHGRRVLLIVDEAQNLPRETLEELRVLSNLDYGGTPLFQVFLIGQPDFKETMERADMEQLRQRVIASYHLDPMTRDETEKYIEHRLGFVGWNGDPAFTKDAYDAIHAATGGLPRKIHKLCNRVLLFCSVEDKHQAHSSTVGAVLADMSSEQLSLPVAAEFAADDFDAEAVKAVAEKVEVQPAPTIAEETPAEEEETAPSSSETREPANAEAPTMKEETAIVAAAVEPASVFDRLRAKKATQTAPTEESRSPAAAPRPPKPATLDDVANAIAAARVSRNGSPDSWEAESDEAGAAELEAGAGNHGDPETEGPEGWRKSVVISINDTRDELKRAHLSVTRLRRHLTEIDRRRRKRRVQIAASLDRAETLLAEFQNAWR